MTDANIQRFETRLNQVETTVAANADAIDQLAHYQTRAFEGLGELTQLTGQLGRHLNQLMTQVEQQGNHLDQLTTQVEQLSAYVSQVTQRVDQVTQRVDSLAAASERFDRIMDYLLKREDEDAAD
ncbi:hypothetical protein [Halomicronema sp. CCY15110]|uniref:hypothetical protein n=1 Tax=Halomicronema sp. CCY15110 TaxID=2767773 RepID=UPI00194DECB0|nr:hypothetical protein [Halomicronema sp. CCY15110]